MVLHNIVEHGLFVVADALDNRRHGFVKLNVERMRECAALLVTEPINRHKRHIAGRRTLPETDLANVPFPEWLLNAARARARRKGVVAHAMLQLRYKRWHARKRCVNGQSCREASHPACATTNSIPLGAGASGFEF